MDPLDAPEDASISNKLMMTCLELVLNNNREETKNVEETSRIFIRQSEKVLEEVADKSNGVGISGPIIKLYRDKYAIWFEVASKSNRYFKDFYFSLHWNSTEELTYVSSMHPVVSEETTLNDPLVYLKELKEKALLVIVIDRPDFLNELSIEIDGILNYCDAKGRQYVDEIPTILIGTEDITDRDVNLPPIEGDQNFINFYSRLICSFKVDLVMQLAEDQNIVNSLEKARMIPLNAPSVGTTRFHAISDRSYPFDGAILELTITDALSNIMDISVYTKDVESLLAFFHYLYQSIKPSCILPIEYKIRLPVTWNVRPEEHLKECIAEEIQMLKKLCVPSNIGDYENTRKKLIACERDTDLAYVACLVAKDKSERVSSEGSEGSVEFMEQ